VRYPNIKRHLLMTDKILHLLRAEERRYLVLNLTNGIVAL